MTFNFKATRPGDILFTLTTTLSLRQWVEVRDALIKAEGSWHGAVGEMTRAINDLVRQSSEVYEPKTKAADQTQNAADT